MSAGGGGGEAATPDELIGGAPLLVFAAEACPYCLELRRELASAGLEPEVHMLDASGREALRQRTGQRTVPYVFVGERFVGGCDDGPEPWMGAMPLLRSGALQQLLDSGSLPADAAALQATARTPVPRRNVALAAGSALAAASLYAYQRLDPLDPVTLLRKLEAESPPLPQARAAGRGCLSATSRPPLGHLSAASLSAASRLPLGHLSAASRPPLGSLSLGDVPALPLGRTSAASRRALPLGALPRRRPSPLAAARWSSFTRRGVPSAARWRR